MNWLRRVWWRLRHLDTLAANIANRLRDEPREVVSDGPPVEGAWPMSLGRLPERGK